MHLQWRINRQTVAARCWLRRDRNVAGKVQPQRRTLYAVKPSEEGKRLEPEIVEEEELPEFEPDHIFNAHIRNEETDITKMDPDRRRTRIIVDLVNAGGLFEDKLKEYQEYLDATLLEAFYKRIEMAEKHEDRNAGEGLRLIWRRVRAEVERKNASPSMRLLDKLLTVLHPSAGGTSQDRYRSTLGLMYEAFTHSPSGTVDIFSLAETLAEGTPAPSGLLQEFVPKNTFVGEVEALLWEAQQNEVELIKRKEEIVQQQMEVEIDSKEYKDLAKKLLSLEQFVVERERSLKDITLLLEMARAI